jgi:hypothetical protein
MRRAPRLAAAAALALAALIPALPTTSAEASLPLLKADVSDFLADARTAPSRPPA